MKQELGVLPGDNFISFSSEIGLGRDELWELIERYNQASEEEPVIDPEIEDAGNEVQPEEPSEA
ncbi:hypothetical protein D3C74_457580 [compost metagenome]